MNPRDDNQLSERDEQRLRAAENTAYSYKFISYAALLLAMIALAVAAVSVITASNNGGNATPSSLASSASAASVAPKLVTVAMHDPGCHSFLVGQAYQTSETVSGPVELNNSDEDTLNVAGPKGVQSDPVGQRLSLAPGTYTITMVKQAPDDNTLHLTVN